MRLGWRQYVKPLWNGCLVNDFKTQGIDLVDLIPVKFNLWWIQLDVDIAVGLFECVYHRRTKVLFYNSGFVFLSSVLRRIVFGTNV